MSIRTFLLYAGTALLSSAFTAVALTAISIAVEGRDAAPAAAAPTQHVLHPAPAPASQQLQRRLHLESVMHKLLYDHAAYLEEDIDPDIDPDLHELLKNSDREFLDDLWAMIEHHLESTDCSAINSCNNISLQEIALYLRNLLALY